MLPYNCPHLLSLYYVNTSVFQWNRGGGGGTRSPALGLTTSLRGDFFFANNNTLCRELNIFANLWDSVSTRKEEAPSSAAGNRHALMANAFTQADALELSAGVP